MVEDPDHLPDEATAEDEPEGDDTGGGTSNDEPAKGPDEGVKETAGDGNVVESSHHVAVESRNRRYSQRGSQNR